MLNSSKSKPITIFFCLLLILSGEVFAQEAKKRNLTSEIISSWRYLSSTIKVTDDGNYIIYGYSDEKKGNPVTYLQKVNGTWQKELIGVNPVSCEADPSGRFVVYPDRNGLSIYELGTNKSQYIENAKTDQDIQFTKLNGKPALVYKNTGRSGLISICIKDLVSGQTLTDNEVLSTWKSVDGSELLLTKKENNKVTLKRFEHKSGEFETIYTGERINNVTFDNAKRSVAFTDKVGEVTSIFLSNLPNGKTIKIADDRAVVWQDERLKIERLEQFVAENKSLLITFKKGTGLGPIEKEPMPILRIWSFSDITFTGDPQFNISYKGLVSIGARKIKVVYDDSDRKEISVTDKYLIVTKKDNALSKRNWNRYQNRSYVSLISTYDGRVKSLNSLNIALNEHKANWVDLSPSSKYLVYFSQKRGSFFRYDIQTERATEITDSIFSLQDTGLKSFLSSDNFIVTDKYRTWNIDISGERKPICITNNSAASKELDYFIFDQDLRGKNDRDSVLATVYDYRTRKNGFTWLKLDTDISPKLLLYGNDYYFHRNVNANFQYFPVKAKKSDVYIFVRQNYDSSPNLFTSQNFREIRQVTNYYPERNFNWAKTKMLYWKSTLDSGTSVLFQPHDFDSTKTYPVIVSQYAEMGHKYNTYPSLESNLNGPIDDLSILVRKGYLVLCPDIRNYRVGETGNTAYKAVMGALNELVKFPFVDSNKIGLHGHSFGGFETIYLIAHSNRFKAAFESSGSANLISDLGNNRLNFPPTYMTEEGQYNLGTTLWQNPGTFINNSPLFIADKINTPLLMMHNRADPAVQFHMGMALFGAMYRLGRPAWMLEYKDESHFLNTEKAKNDLTTRVTQFFDHYLKGQPAPKWMLNQLPAKQRPLESGFVLDDTGRKPGPGVLTDAEKKKVDEYSKIPLKEKLRRLKD